MSIRVAVIDDAPEIARVHVDSWRTTYQGLLPEDLLSGLSYERRERWWHDVLSKEERQDQLFVAEEDGAVVGFVSCGAERTSNPDYTGELYAIYLLQQAQRRGMGRELTRAAAQWLLEQGHTSMLVWVLEGNPAVRFYEALGGIALGQKPFTLGNAERVEISYGWRDIRPLV
jgi:GNAT superfamily N-acetyltransferase